MKLTNTLLSLIATLSLAVVATTPPSDNSQATLVVDNDDDADLNVPGKNPLEFCEDPKDYLLDIDNVDLKPNPPKAGENLTITATGTLKKKVKKGTHAFISVKYGIVKILSQDMDLCKQAGKIDLECPLDEGDITFERIVELPKEIPPGKYNVLANVTNKEDEIVTCLTASVLFKPHFGAMWGSEEL